MPKRDSRSAYYAIIREAQLAAWQADPANKGRGLAAALAGPTDLMPILKRCTRAELSAHADALRPHVPKRNRGRRPRLIPGDDDAVCFRYIEKLVRHGKSLRNACALAARKFNLEPNALRSRYRRFRRSGALRLAALP